MTIPRGLPQNSAFERPLYQTRIVVRKGARVAFECLQNVNEIGLIFDHDFWLQKPVGQYQVIRFFPYYIPCGRNHNMSCFLCNHRYQATARHAMVVRQQDGKIALLAASRKRWQKIVDEVRRWGKELLNALVQIHRIESDWIITYLGAVTPHPQTIESWENIVPKYSDVEMQAWLNENTPFIKRARFANQQPVQPYVNQPYVSQQQFANQPLQQVQQMYKNQQLNQPMNNQQQAQGNQITWAGQPVQQSPAYVPQVNQQPSQPVNNQQQQQGSRITWGGLPVQQPAVQPVGQPAVQSVMPQSQSGVTNWPPAADDNDSMLPDDFESGV